MSVVGGRQNLPHVLLLLNRTTSPPQISCSVTGSDVRNLPVGFFSQQCFSLQLTINPATVRISRSHQHATATEHYRPLTRSSSVAERPRDCASVSVCSLLQQYNTSSALLLVTVLRLEIHNVYCAQINYVLFFSAWPSTDVNKVDACCYQHTRR